MDSIRTSTLAVRGRETTWTGDIRRLVPLPSTEPDRPVWVYLPPSYGTGSGRYPVLYFHDGQNVFDRHTAFAGVEWGADESLESLSRAHEIDETIAVAIANTPRRIDEYTPVTDSRGGGRAADYVRFLVHELKPRIDAEYRTRPGREHCGVVGSSLGGLVSLYAALAAPETFGLVGALSPVFDWAGYDIEWRYRTARATSLPLRIWIDMGTAEDPHPARDGEVRRAMRDLRRFRTILEHQGYAAGRNLGYEEALHAGHDEAAWAERLPRVLRFLVPRSE